MPAGSSDPGIWTQPVAPQRQARNLFSNQAASHGRHLPQRWRPLPTSPSQQLRRYRARHSP